MTQSLLTENSIAQHPAIQHPVIPNQAVLTLVARLAILTLILATFAVRVIHLDRQSLWRDEVDAIYFALRQLSQTLAMFIDAGQNGALYMLSLRPWLSAVGSSEFALRFPSAFSGTLSVVLLWKVAQRFFGMQGAKVQSDRVAEWQSGRSLQPCNPATGNLLPFIASLLLALNPYQVWYGQEGKMYATNTALTLFATWFWLRGMTAGGWRPWLAYLFTVSIAMYTHLLMIMLIPLHMLWFVLAWPQNKVHWRGYLLALAGLTLPYLPFVWWQWELLVAPNKLTGFNFVPLPEMLEKLMLSHSFGFAPHTELLWLAPLIFLAVAGLSLGWSELSGVNGEGGAGGEGRETVAEPVEATAPLPTPHAPLSFWQRFLMLLTWVSIPILEIWVMSLRQPVYTERYVIWIAPAAAMLIALGAGAVRTAFGRMGTLLIGLLVVYVLGFWLYLGWQQQNRPIKFQLREAVAYIQQQRTNDSLLILQIPHLEWSYRYYTSAKDNHPFEESDARLGHWIQGLWTNHGQSEQEVDTQMRALTANFNEVWVLLSEVDMWDSRHLMEAWLDQHGMLLEQQPYYGVEVRKYRLSMVAGQ